MTKLWGRTKRQREVEASTRVEVADWLGSVANRVDWRYLTERGLELALVSTTLRARPVGLALVHAGLGRRVQHDPFQTARSHVDDEHGLRCHENQVILS